jgi:adenylyltransferase/sulfurtransferase
MAMRAINSLGVYEPFVFRLSAVNVESTFAAFDVIVDCTDNPGTRFLINDACVLSGKPLVSGAALTTDGQLSVYNFANGPCYRCIHKAPPVASTVQSCSDAGVLGPVVGVIGCLQALEVLKVAASRAYSKELEAKCEPPFGQPLAGK